MARLLSVLMIISFLSVSCNDTAKTDTAEVNPDSMPVVKMNTDSVSDMPVQVPKDSTAQMPNPYDTLKK